MSIEPVGTVVEYGSRYAALSQITEMIQRMFGIDFDESTDVRRAPFESTLDGVGSSPFGIGEDQNAWLIVQDPDQRIITVDDVGHEVPTGQIADCTPETSSPTVAWPWTAAYQLIDVVLHELKLDDASIISAMGKQTLQGP